MSRTHLAFVGDHGNQRESGTRFPYRNSTEAAGAVAGLIRSHSAFAGSTDLIALGDLVYNTAASTTFDANVGQYFKGTSKNPRWLELTTSPAIITTSD
ncbi:MAG: hypothetical protein FJ077_14545 [Cyanobacteria bacterium K_DeepCast_35m_m2_023]|nr:hypothetical protein [Cyanobacteria bacterium K_DeepCast_35m_m2_023]